MKTLKLLFVLSLSTFTIHLTFGQTWLWATHLYTRTPNDPRCPVAIDKSGNAYVTGSTQTDTLRIGNTMLMGKYGVTYFAKYSPSGAVVWGKQLTGNVSTSGITTDKSGNFYLSGNFGDTLKIGSSTLISRFDNGAFLAKFDSNGNPLWAKQCQTSSRNCYVGIGFVTTDMSNNVFITGDFEDTVSFGSFTLTMLNNSQGNDRAIFLVKYDSNGNALWAEQSKTPSVANYGGSSYSVTTDNSGNSYITGNFGDTLSFGTFSLTVGGAFLVKYSASGSVLWAEQSTGGGSGSSVITDGINSYVTGSFENNIQFGSHTLSSPGVNSIFITKYDVNGNVDWAQESSPGWIGNGLAADAYTHIYLTGTTYGANIANQLKFGSYAISNPLPKTASFVMELDSAGAPLCGSLLNDPSSGATNGIASDPLGNHIYLSSIFWDTLFYNGDTILGPSGGFSTFVARWQSCILTNGIASISSQKSNVKIYPNPNNGTFQLELKNEELGMKNMIEVYNMLGAKVYATYQITKSSNYQIDLRGQPNGIYLYRVTDETGNLIGDGKFIIQK